MVRSLVTEIAAVERRGAQPPSVIGRHARFAKRANHISALSGAPLPLCPKGAKEGKRPEDAKLRPMVHGCLTSESGNGSRAHDSIGLMVRSAKRVSNHGPPHPSRRALR